MTQMGLFSSHRPLKAENFLCQWLEIWGRRRLEEMQGKSGCDSLMLVMKMEIGRCNTQTKSSKSNFNLSEN